MSLETGAVTRDMLLSVFRGRLRMGGLELCESGRYGRMGVNWRSLIVEMRMIGTR